MARAFPEVGIEHEVRQRRARQDETWRRHADALRLIRERIVPAGLVDPLKLVECRQDYGLDRSKTKLDRYKVRPLGACHQVPWCIPCTQVGVWKRVRRAEDRLSAWTPEGEAPRSLHMVFTAPLTEQGKGWGAKAMVSLEAFFGVVVDTLKEHFGPGIGVQASYQDFGEIPFTKSHPHIDLTMNGWMIEGKDIVAVKFDLGKDKEELNATYDDKALRFGLDVRPGNSWVGPPRRGLRAARGALAYQMRELVDTRKVCYGADGLKVGWRSYRDQSVDWIQAGRFVPWYQAYARRVRPDEANRLHRKFGFMSNRFSSKAKAMGFSGKPSPHDEGCACRDCDDWERVVDAASKYPVLDSKWRPAF